MSIHLKKDPRKQLEELRENNLIEYQALTILEALKNPGNYWQVIDNDGKRRLAARLDICTTEEGKIRINGIDIDTKGHNEEKIITNVKSLLDHVFTTLRKTQERSPGKQEPLTLACKVFKAPQLSDQSGSDVPSQDTAMNYRFYVGNMGVELPDKNSATADDEVKTLLQATVDYVAANQRILVEHIRVELFGTHARYRQ